MSHTMSSGEYLWYAVANRLSVGTAEHNKTSFNYFVRHQLAHVLRESAEIVATNSEGRTHVVQLFNVHVQPPSILEASGSTSYVTPNDCRRRSLTYASDVCGDVVHDVVDKEGVVNRRVYRSATVTRIPVMLRSDACALTAGKGVEEECVADSGGYFIVNGTEKSLLSQAKLRTNRTFIFDTCSGNTVGRHRTAEVRSVSESKLRSTSTLYVHVNDVLSGATPNIVAELPFLTSPISLATLYRLMGLEGTVEELIDEVVAGSAANGFSAAVRSVVAVSLSVQSEGGPRNFEEAFDFVGRAATKENTTEKRNKYVSHILSNEVLPHIGVNLEETTLASKRFFLSRSVLRLVSVALGETEPDDRDDLTQRRVDAPGAMIALLLRQLYRNGIRQASVGMTKAIEDPKKEAALYAPDLLYCKKTLAGLRYAFATGVWGVGRSGTTAHNGQLGVAQVLSRLNAVSACASLRRVNTPLAREGRAAGPRQLHSSSFGYLCVAETPEGAACGLVTNLALMATVRVGFPSQCLLESLLAAGAQPFKVDAEGVVVLLNGSPAARLADGMTADAFALHLRERRRNGELPIETSIGIEEGDIVISSDAGALIRPVVVASRWKLFQSTVEEDRRRPGLFYGGIWEELVRRGCIEWIDPLEQRCARVALWPNHLSETMPGKSAFTHLELHPALALGGLMLNLSPFAHMNPGPRSAYQAAQGKQAVGLYSSAFRHRVDVMAHVLVYPARPLATTRVEEILTTKHTRAGALPIVAVLALDGYNQEDSLYLSAGAVQRGMFSTIYLQTYRDEARGAGADQETFENPQSAEGCLGLKEARYEHLGDGGLPKVGTKLRPGDVVIGKTVACSAIEVSREKNEARRSMKRCKSTVLKGDEDVMVDEVIIGTAPDGAVTVKVRLRSVRMPRVGDKFSSRHGQKGVVGKLLTEDELPRTEEGVAPDLIMNVHALPSRMTVGHLAEMLAGLVALQTGQPVDATMFTGCSIEEMKQMIGGDAETRMRCGETGRWLEGKVFLAPCFYQRLKHMCIDKKHARARGTRQLLSRQPVEGRSRDGGLRVGEMERDALASHGASQTVQDRLLDASDSFTTTVCFTCGGFAVPASDKEVAGRPKPARCIHCGPNADLGTINIPFAFKLLSQELGACGISTRLQKANGI